MEMIFTFEVHMSDINNEHGMHWFIVYSFNNATVYRLPIVFLKFFYTEFMNLY